jgi:Tfp pilus assembly protein PilX
MTRRMDAQEGSALVIAMFAVAVMLMIGLATYSFVDAQQSQATREHVGESSFRLANAALNAQMFQLGTTWPSTSALAYPSSCTSGAAAGPPCANAAALSSSFTGVEYASGTCPGGVTNGWRTTVRDNGGGATSYYNPAVVPTQPSWDANADGSVWVRAEGTARCRTRATVALVRLSRVPLPFPNNVITANWISLRNLGRKVIVDTLGRYAQPPSVRPPNDLAQAGGVAARCDPASAPTPCVSYDASKGQISPDTTKIGGSGNATTLTDDQIEGLRLQAKTNQPPTYYGPSTTPCPPSLTGQLVFVEDLSGCPQYNGGNSKNSPGVLVFLRGTLTLTGNGVFYGIVYAGNKQGSPGAVVSLNGTSAIQGSVVVDGPGGVVAGSSGTNIVFDKRAFSLLQTLANATMVPNTWRQLP